MAGGPAEDILRKFAKTTETMKYYRNFEAWVPVGNGVYECSGRVGTENEFARPVTLVLGRLEGIHLKDVPGSRCRPRPLGSGYAIHVGKGTSPNRFENIAAQLVSWIVRGGSWSDRRSMLHDLPYGDAQKPKDGTVRPWRGLRFRVHRSEGVFA